LISIDENKCKRDGICAAECPFGLISLENNNGFPEIDPAKEKICINCGHCVSICPQGALSLNKTSSDDCHPIPFGPAPNFRKVSQLLKGRRSIRSYDKQPVPHNNINNILDVCCWAPSARNEQPVHWLIIENSAEVNKLAGIVVDWLRDQDKYKGMVECWDNGRDMVLRGAPHLAVVHANTNKSKPMVDCTIALSYFDLAAFSDGIGCCWAGILMSAAAAGYKPLLESLNLPDKHELYGAMMFGYPRHPYHRVPLRDSLKVSWRS
jgi:nitroreductase/NAD-dependent dihydropyrimidine dehydrogenase PreA subunit